jgi:hypothetical protein
MTRETESAAARAGSEKRAVVIGPNAITPPPLGARFSVNQSDPLSSLLDFWLPGEDSNLQPCG